MDDRIARAVADARRGDAPPPPAPRSAGRRSPWKIGAAAVCVAIGVAWVIAGQGVIMQGLGLLFTLSSIGSLARAIRP